MSESRQFPAFADQVISVIIPTVCSRSRLPELRRAVDSVLSQAGVSVELIVVINGDQWDRDLAAKLLAEPRLKVHFSEVANVSHARLVGLKVSCGAYYCFLDDDDELLPGALAARSGAMDELPSADVLVTDGYIRTSVEVLSFRGGLGDAVRQDPARAYLQRNWFYSPSATFRRATVGAEYFDMQYKYFEWTYLLFRLLCAGKLFQCIDDVTYRKFEGQVGSVSSSRDYQLALPAFLGDVLLLPLPLHVKQVLNVRRLIALNTNANLHLEAGEMRQALDYHMQCVMAGGWRYLPFGRRLVVAYFRRICSRQL